LKVGVPLVKEMLSLKTSVGADLFWPAGLRGSMKGLEPGYGKGRILATRRTNMKARLAMPRTLLVSWETVF
jgi:hypothetical protein